MGYHADDEFKVKDVYKDSVCINNVTNGQLLCASVTSESRSGFYRQQLCFSWAIRRDLIKILRCGHGGHLACYSLYRIQFPCGANIAVRFRPRRFRPAGTFGIHSEVVATHSIWIRKSLGVRRCRSSWLTSLWPCCCVGCRNLTWLAASVRASPPLRLCYVRRPRFRFALINAAAAAHNHRMPSGGG